MLASAPALLVGHPRPRLAPPVPLRSDIAGFRAVAESISVGPVAHLDICTVPGCTGSLIPWQDVAATYIEALAPDGRHLYREIAVVVSRQQGKSALLKPLIVKRLRAGCRIIHTAQNREIPRETFSDVAEEMERDQTLFPERRGRRLRPRFANGQEEIKTANGGLYRIVAPTRGGARGTPGVDLVIVDEVREMDDWNFIAAAKPTMTASPDPQIIYMSNAGHDESVVLNALRDRAEQDPTLAYLEWSAAPDRESDDEEGWAEANPAIGHNPAVMETLRAEHRAAVLSGTMAMFETEHLCRWVPTMRERLVNESAWNGCFSERLPKVGRSRAVMAVAMDPSGKRASAALAWMDGDRIYARLLYDVPGNPIDTHALGEDLKAYAERQRIGRVAFDPMTDGELAKFFGKRAEPLSGAKFANATSTFANLVASGRLAWNDAHAVSEDLLFTARKPHEESQSFTAVRAVDSRPITAALAFIRAVGLASGPRTPRARIY